MAGVNIEKARQQAKVFLQKNVGKSFPQWKEEGNPEAFDAVRFCVKSPEQFEAFIQSIDAQEGELDLIDEGEAFYPDPKKMNFRQFLNFLAEEQFHLPFVDEAMRHQIAQEKPIAYMNVALTSGGLADDAPVGTPKDYFEFLDALVDFSQGGPIPQADMMRQGMAMLQSWRNQQLKDKKDANSDKSDPTALEEDAINKAVSDIMNYTTQLSLRPHTPEIWKGNVPDYVPEPIKQQLEALREQVKNGEIDTHDAMEVRGELRKVLRPIVEEHYRVTGQNLKEAAEHHKKLEKKADSEYVLYAHVADQIHEIAENLGIKIDDPGKNPPPQHRPRF